MNNLLQISPELYEKKRDFAKGSMDRLGIYENIGLLGSEIAYKPTEKKMKICESLEKSLGTFLSLTELFEDSEMFKDYRRDKKKTFINAYSLYVGSLIGIDEISKHVKHHLGSGDYPPINFENVSLGLTADLLRNYKKIINAIGLEAINIENEEDLVDNTYRFLRDIRDACLKKMREFPELEGEVRNLNIEHDGIKVSGFSKFEGKEETLELFDDLDWSDIIGNDDFKNTFKTLLDQLLLYDPKEHVNPIKKITDLPTKMFVYGPPGTGKSETLKVGANYLQKRAKELGKPIEIVIIDERVRSKYFSESSRLLAQEFKKATNPDKIGLIYLEDIDALIPSRDEMDNSPELKNIFHTLINLLDGVLSRDLGNYLVISTSNNPDGFDKALKQRFEEETFYIRGPSTQQEIIDHFKLRLKKGIANSYVDVQEQDWIEIGKFGFEKKLVGRDIKNICKTLSKESSSGLELKDSIYSLPLEKQEEEIRKMIKRIEGKDILEGMQRHYAELERQGEIQKREEIRRRAEKLEIELRARAEVVKNLT